MIYSIKHKLTFHAALFQVSSYVDINSLDREDTQIQAYQILGEK